MLGLGAIHLNVQFRLVEGLLNPEVHDPWNKLQLVEQLVGEGAVCIQILTHDLHVDRGGQSEIENLADDVGRQEIKSNARKFLVELQPDIVFVLGSWTVIFGQRDQNIGVGAELL